MPVGVPVGRGGLGPPCGAMPGTGAAPSGGTLATLVGATEDITGGVAEAEKKTFLHIAHFCRSSCLGSSIVIYP